MGDHDPLCTYGPEWDRMKGGARGCPECDLIARVRADERERHYRVEMFDDTDGYQSLRVVKGEHVGQNEWAASIRAATEAEVRERLRAEAMNLPSRVELDEVGNEVTWVQYADVCELLGGESDG